VPEGRVRAGVAFRSAAVGDGDAAVEQLRRLGVRVVVDLRTGEERADRPDGCRQASSSRRRRARRGRPRARRPTAARCSWTRGGRRALGDGRAERVFTGKYREFVALDSARQAYRTLFAALAADPAGPLLFHCGTGKDRTGWAAAALLLLLGVDEEAVLVDYLRSGAEIRPSLEPNLEAFRDGGGDPTLLEPIIGTRVAYLEAALDEMRARYASIEGYFADGLGIDDAGRRSLRERLVEPAG
jgi:protein-tyrosine phosphatase